MINEMTLENIILVIIDSFGYSLITIYFMEYTKCIKTLIPIQTSKIIITYLYTI